MGEKVEEGDLQECRVGRAHREDRRYLFSGRDPALLDEKIEEGGDHRLRQGGDVEDRGVPRLPRRTEEDDLVPLAQQEDGGLVRPLPDALLEQPLHLAEPVLVAAVLPGHFAATGDSRRNRLPLASILARTPNGRG